MVEGLLSPQQSNQEFGLCASLSRTQISFGRQCQIIGKPNFGVARGTKDEVFHNKKGLLAYRVDDDNVFRHACYAFPNMFLSFVKMDPFRQAISI
jgi:hypothetical protein